MLNWKCCDQCLDLRRPAVMGILNVTPDSFSDGGKYADCSAAAKRGLQMAEEGAAIIDVGGESTRPGAREVPVEEETRRVVPVIEALSDQTNALLSVDTMKAETARRAVDAGACIINDVSALTHDPAMVELAVRSGAGVILMHMQGSPRTMQENPRYDNVVGEVRDFLKQRITRLAGAGVEKERMAVDPGIGFGKTVNHNLELIRNIDKLVSLGVPVVAGLSRKSFLGRLTGREVDQRLSASLAGLVFCLAKGAHIMRVHDVRESFEAALVTAFLMEGEGKLNDTA